MHHYPGSGNALNHQNKHELYKDLFSVTIVLTFLSWLAVFISDLNSVVSIPGIRISSADLLLAGAMDA